MVNVVAFITAHPGKRDEILAAFRENVSAVRAEDGCIEYGAVVDAEGFGSFQAPIGPDSFLVIEKVGEPRCAQSARTCAAYGGLRGKD